MKKSLFLDSAIFLVLSIFSNIHARDCLKIVNNTTQECEVNISYNHSYETSYLNPHSSIRTDSLRHFYTIKPGWSKEVSEEKITECSIKIRSKFRETYYNPGSAVITLTEDTDGRITAQTDSTCNIM